MRWRIPSYRGWQKHYLDSVKRSYRFYQARIHVYISEVENWASGTAKVQVFPVEAVHLALYLQHVLELTHSKASVEEAVNAVNWMHKLAILPGIGSGPIVSATLSELCHMLAKPVTKKA